MNWGTIGIAGVAMFSIAWIVGVIKVCFFDNRREIKSPTDLKEYDENHPEDFDLVREYSRKATWIILSLSVAITIGGLTFTTIQIIRYTGIEERAFFSAIGMAIAMAFALPCTVMWIINMVCLTRWRRKAGTSLEVHSLERN